MDIAPISIDIESNVNDLECNMPTFGSQNFTFFNLNKDWFLQYENYPIVRASVGVNLFEGLNIPFQIKILPRAGEKTELSKDNINNFYIGMIAQ